VLDASDVVWRNSGEEVLQLLVRAENEIAVAVEDVDADDSELAAGV
jgi:hypothetical protein